MLQQEGQAGERLGGPECEYVQDCGDETAAFEEDDEEAGDIEQN